MLGTRAAWVQNAAPLMSQQRVQIGADIRYNWVSCGHQNKRQFASAAALHPFAFGTLVADLMNTFLAINIKKSRLSFIICDKHFTEHDASETVHVATAYVVYVSLLLTGNDAPNSYYCR